MIYTRQWLLIVIPAFISASLTAETPQKLNIESATVFLRGAQLTSTAKVSFTRGENEILFTNVAGDVNQQSLTVNASGGVVVEAATFQNNYLAEEVISPKAQAIKDSIELLNNYKERLSAKITVLTEQLSVLWENKKVGGANTGLSISELTKLLDLINVRMEGYLNQKHKLEETKKKNDERIAKLSLQLDEEQKKDYQPGGQLLVKFYAKEPTASLITIDYVVPRAGWSPTYDIMADDASGPVKLFYKANIFQNSGVKWNNVRLSLSTGNPNEGAQAPNLTPWYLAFYTPAPVAYLNAANGVPAAGLADVMSKKATDADLPDEHSTMNEFVTVDNAGINTNFDIELPYTIPSDGQQHLVAIKRFELPATYRYFAVPKLDKDVFLQAQLTNWEDLNLLPGETNIFYEGTYVGRGSIDVRNVKDTMTISLGRDKKIVAKRELDTRYRSVKTIGSNVHESFAYTIALRNTRKEPISLVVQDQLPVSNDKDISVEDKETDGAESNETTGMLTWTVSLKSNEARSLHFGYTVKYPKGKTIAGLR